MSFIFEIINVSSVLQSVTKTPKNSFVASQNKEVLNVIFCLALIRNKCSGLSGYIPMSLLLTSQFKVQISKLWEVTNPSK
jgi:hypothetical protein